MEQSPVVVVVEFRSGRDLKYCHSPGLEESMNPGEGSPVVLDVLEDIQHNHRVE